MATFKTPGVYIEEIQTLAPSVAPVPTSIPGFVGYTEKALFLDGSSASMKPVRITSLLEFEQIFGGPFKETFDVTLTGTVPSPTSFTIAPTSIPSAIPPSLSPYILYYQLRMFYANGGGTCYVTSVGLYTVAGTIAPADLQDGIDTMEQIDEVTLLATPEIVFLDQTDALTTNDMMLVQCAKLQDRFALIDTLHITGNTIQEDADDFRNLYIGPDNLKYAAAYYPALNTALNYFYDNSAVTILDTRAGAPYNTAPNNTLNTILNGASAYINMTVASTLTLTDLFEINFPAPVGLLTLIPVNDFPPGSNTIEGAENLTIAINSNSAFSKQVTAIWDGASGIQLIIKTPGTSGASYAFNPTSVTAYSPLNDPFDSPLANSAADKTLYNQITSELAKRRVQLYPCATMAGIYARVDDERGVWKAPANVGVRFISEPSLLITAQDQENLNVDSVSGKSINAIRPFTGRGNLVWGARTLAGNDNEWRYVNVRRLFIFAEESIKKATEFVVFEPNAATTWSRVKGMAESFLTGLWRDGALAGATTQEAFFVKVGLGTTMTPQDILEGRMIVEIGLAAVRPAEFIILRFSHKLQES